MLKVKVGARKEVYVKFTEDTIPNKGGYFCEVYEDENGEFKYDEFTLQASSLRSSTNKKELACILATNKVKNIFGIF